MDTKYSLRVHDGVMKATLNNGDIESMQATISDLMRQIDDLKQSNASLRSEKEILDTIIDSLPGTFYIWDDRPRLIRWNRKHEEITEYSGDEYPDMLPTDFFGKQEHRAIEAAVERTFTEGEVTVEATLLTKTGKKIPHVYSAVSTVIDQQPVLLGYGIDISDRVETERRLKRAYTEIKKLKKQLEAECAYLSEEIKLVHDYSHIIGDSEVMKYVLYSIDQIAQTDTTVLILGESGTGKELVARAIHSNSRRNQRPLIKVDCAVLPDNLIESELFGHEKGAFTGALEKRIGRFELADRATIFLDEIGELPLNLQKKLLRVLQDGEFERLGSTKAMHTDVRVIAATNRDLEADTHKRRFRKDLWYRLNVLPMSLPPLRDRKEDIPLLVDWIVKKVQRRIGKRIQQIPNAVMEQLIGYDWPGNVRELENVIERAIIFSQDESLQLASALSNTRATHASTPDAAPMKCLAEMEKEHILRALDATHWNVSGEGGAADLLGINASTLRGRMRKHGIRRASLHNR